jgi:hypothetical protein
VVATDRWRSEAPRVYPPAYMAKRRVGVEYSPSMLEPVCPGAVSPDRALCLPTFSHFLIVNKTSLSLALSLPLSLSLFSSDCDLQLHRRLAQMGSWLGQFGTGATGAKTRHDDDDDRSLL